MKKKSFFSIAHIFMILFVYVFLIPAITVASKSREVLPEDLKPYADENKCMPIDDYYEQRIGDVKPPYVYGYLPGPEKDSAVFWCQKDTGVLFKDAVLVFVYKNSNDELTQCPARIDWVNPPRGLSFYKDEETTLDMFIYLEDPKKHGPKGVKMKHHAVMSEDDGVADVFYCHEGKWLLIQWH